MIIGLISLFLSIFIVVVNISSIYFQKQKLQSIIDQAALLGTNYIDVQSYYKNSLLNNIFLDQSIAYIEINDYIKDYYNFSDINFLKIKVVNNEIYIQIDLKHYLPFEVPYRAISINATTSAKLILD